MVSKPVSPRLDRMSRSVLTEAEAMAARQIKCPRCGQEMGDRDEAEGCRDFHCPMQEPK